jgi:uncharacterized protein YbjT (DUF2867 family)
VNPILVIGATGHIGSQVVAQLAATGVPVRAMNRNPEPGRLPKQAELVRGDLTRPETLDAGLEGVDKVFLVWMAPPATAEAALERIAKQARRIVFLTAPIKTPHPFFQQPNPSSALAQRIENLIEASGREYSFVRGGMFAINCVDWWGSQIRSGDVVRWPYLDSPTAPTHEADIAAVAVRALREDGHSGKEYIVTGPKSLTQREQIAIVGDAIGRSLRAEEITPEEARRELLPIMPPVVINLLLNAWAAGLGQPAFVASDFESLMGRPLQTFRQWVNDHAGEFQTSSHAQG